MLDDGWIVQKYEAFCCRDNMEGRRWPVVEPGRRPILDEHNACLKCRVLVTTKEPDNGKSKPGEKVCICEGLAPVAQCVHTTVQPRPDARVFDLTPLQLIDSKRMLPKLQKKRSDIVHKMSASLVCLCWGFMSCLSVTAHACTTKVKK